MTMTFQGNSVDTNREELAFLLSGSREEATARSCSRFDAVTLASSSRIESENERFL